MTVSFIGLALFVNACEKYETQARYEQERRTKEYAEEELKTWIGECHDQSWLLATTFGSPDSAKCPNRKHKMKVQLASAPSHEEFGAVVFCECERDAGQ
jgi:hypothetical protein